MGFFDKLFPKKIKDEPVNVGNTEPICPSCGTVLPKMPGRKITCPNCSEPIFVRTRPSDRKKILVNKLQVEIVEEQWAIVTGTHEQYLQDKQEVENVRSELRQRFGAEPSEGDVRWSLLNQHLIKHGANNDWGFYRNTRLEMGEALEKEKRYRIALTTYLEVMYIDLNGPNNLGGIDPNAERYPRFEPTPPHSFVAPGMLRLVRKMISVLNLSIDDTKSLFAVMADQLHSNLRLPIKPEIAWNKLSKELNQPDN